MHIAPSAFLSTADTWRVCMMPRVRIARRTSNGPAVWLLRLATCNSHRSTRHPKHPKRVNSEISQQTVQVSVLWHKMHMMYRSRPSGPEQTSLACSLAFAKCGRRLSMLWDMPWQDITRSWSLELRLFKHPASCQQYSSQRATEAICEGSRICPGPS